MRLFLKLKKCLKKNNAIKRSKTCCFLGIKRHYFTDAIEHH
jgi:hypothetical protein